MKTKNMVWVGLMVVATLSVSAFAEEGVAGKQGDKAKAGKGNIEKFKAADVDKDGKLSLDEFKTFAKGDVEKKFLAADADKDNFLTPEEFKAAPKHGKQKKEGEAKAKAEAVVPVVPGQ
jgi:hypothetical protein